MEDNWIGKQIGPYEILKQTEKRDTTGHLKYLVKCKYCGFEKYVSPRLLVGKKDHCPHITKYGTTSFSCAPNSSEEKRLHGIFNGMLVRCFDPSNKSYRFYGGKGITICPEWRENPDAFVEWAKNNGYQNNLTIDRIDPSLGYCPSNCRWVSSSQNSSRTDVVKPITVNGITNSGCKWSRILHMGRNYINGYRKKYGLEATIEFIKYKIDTIEG